MSFRSKKLLDSARDQPCAICGAVGTTVAAHTNSVALGKGIGIKAPDYYVAYVCQYHHDMIDGREHLAPPYQTRQELWQWAYIKTVARWFNSGLVQVT